MAGSPKKAVLRNKRARRKERGRMLGKGDALAKNLWWLHLPSPQASSPRRWHLYENKWWTPSLMTCSNKLHRKIRDSSKTRRCRRVKTRPLSEFCSLENWRSMAVSEGPKAVTKYTSSFAGFTEISKTKYLPIIGSIWLVCASLFSIWTYWTSFMAFR